MKIFKKTIFTIFTVFIVLLLAYNIYNFVCIRILKKDISTVGGYGMLEVVSGSMEPTIKVGDIIVIDVEDKDYKIGDIITFRDINGSFVTHRIISIEDNVMVTQGDANDSVDEEMSVSSIVGKYTMRIPGAGKLITSLKNPLVMTLILAIGVLVCFLVSTDDELKPIDLTEEEKEFLEFKKNKEKEKNKKERE